MIVSFSDEKSISVYIDRQHTSSTRSIFIKHQLVVQM